METRIDIQMNSNEQILQKRKKQNIVEQKRWCEMKLKTPLALSKRGLEICTVITNLGLISYTGIREVCKMVLTREVRVPECASVYFNFTLENGCTQTDTLYHSMNF